MPTSTSEYTKKTLAAWDEVAPKHAAINASLTSDVTDPGFNNLNPDFNTLIDSHDVANKSVVQICCNNGIDLLSVKNKGSGRCLGIDGSQMFIEQAIGYAKSAGYPEIEFVCTDIYDLPVEFHNSFDFAIITVGVLGWMPDIARFMSICASLLKPGGQLLMEEIHPVLGMYEEGTPSTLTYSYFNSEPFKDTDGLDYFTGQKYDAKENYYFEHTLSDILMSAIASNLQLEHIQELPYNVGNFCADLEFIETNPPLGIILSWQKRA